MKLARVIRQCGLVIVAALTVSVSVAVADTQQCYVDQFVMNRSAVPAKRQKAVDSLEKVGHVAMELSSETRSAMLVEPRAMILRRAGRDTEANKERYTRQHLCAKFEREKRRSKRLGEFWAKRRYQCDCNGVLAAKEVPNDQHYPLQWGFNEPLQNGVNVDMNMPEAWDIWKGTRSTVVAVIDSGVDYSHPDLAANMWVNQSEKYGQPGVDDDGNGWVDDIHGINAIANTASPGNPMDDNGHGTHVAGTIGAVGNNEAGVVGVNWAVSIIGVKFLRSNGSGSLYDSVRAIDYVTDLKLYQGVDVVLSNNSWGGGSGFHSLQTAIERAGSAGILFVAAAGNEGKNIDTSVSYPAAYPMSNIVSVAAIDQAGRLASFSNYGVSNVDIAAPGVQIASTYPNGGYRYLQGTSMASPHVAGALALLKSRAPGLNASQLRDILYATGQPLAALSGVIKTGKTVDMFAMLNAADEQPAPNPEEPQPTPTPGQTPPPQATPTPTPEPTPTPQPTPGVFDLAGRVLLAPGLEPVPGARIELQLPGGTEVRFTGVDGRFSYEDVDGPVEYNLQAVKSGTRSQLISGLLKNNENLSIVMQPNMVSLIGSVRNTENIPVVGITVDAGELGVRVTDEDGGFQFTTRFGSDYEMTFKHPVYTFPHGVATGTAWGETVRIVVAED
jgi:hypothetical protein